jgi:hypothetical protein
MPDSLIGVSKQRVLPYLACRPWRAAEDAAEIADVLAEDDDIVVARHRHVHGAAHRLDHRHAWSYQYPAFCRWRRICGGISA